MKRAPPTKAPVSQEVVETMKKKISQPAGPPPSNITNFKTNKNFNSNYDEINDESMHSDDHDDNQYISQHHADEKQVIRNHDINTSKYDENDENDLEDDMKYKSQAKLPSNDTSSNIKVKTEAKLSDNNDSTATTVTTESNIVYNFHTLLSATYRELRSFSYAPCEKGKVVRCYIERDKVGTNAFYPFYSLCADMDDGTGRELMVCRKVWNSRTPHYVFSLKIDDLYRKREQRSRLYLGKLRGISSDEYVLYDNGICRAPDGEPGDHNDDEEITEEEMEAHNNADKSNAYNAQKKSSSSDGEDNSLYRKELAIIHFNAKKRPVNKGVRGTEVCLLSRNQNASWHRSETQEAVTSKSTPVSYVSTFAKIRENGKQNSSHRNKLFIIHEKSSKYDPLSSCLVDFKGRATVPSVKNCQFITSDPSSEFDVFNGKSTLEENNPDPEFVLELGKVNQCVNSVILTPCLC